MRRSLLASLNLMLGDKAAAIEEESDET